MSNEIIDAEFQIVPFREEIHDPRIPVVLLVDVSASMAEEGKIDEVNALVPELLNGIRDDFQARRRVELSVVSFSDEPKVLHDFALERDWSPIHFTTENSTAMGRAINLALDMTEQRKETYKSHGTPYYEPWIIILTDGQPTDDIGPAIERLRDYRSRDKVVFIAIGIGNEENLFPTLKSITPLAGELKQGAWKELIAWLIENFALRSKTSTTDRYTLSDSDAWRNPVT